MRNYRFAVSEVAFQFLGQVSKADRERLAGTFRALSKDPFAEPDGTIPSAARTFSVRKCGRYLVIYWVDHAVAEVRIVDILAGK
jgi:hypothetical protein